MRWLSSLLLIAVSTTALSQSPKVADSGTVAGQAVGQTGNEAKAARAFEAARKQGPLALHEFLLGMPKGADLHVHLVGAVYAENFIRAAAEDGLCVDTKALSFAKPPAGGCPRVLGQMSATELLGHIQTSGNQALYDKLIDSFSMRGFVPSEGWTGHDQFFSTFDHFGGTSKRHTGEWIDEIATRAASQNEQYLELMDTPPFGHAAVVASRMGWDENLAEYRQKLLAADIDQEVQDAKEYIEAALALRNKLEHCDAEAGAKAEDKPSPACKVQVRLIYQVLRGFPKEQVFAQTLLGFETISKMPEFVGINFVQPEDGYLSMKDYTLQMKMLD